MESQQKRRGPTWDAGQVRALRQHLGLSQRQLAEELGTRQQTISEWETGVYQPRGASARLLTLVAERAGFPYEAGQAGEGIMGPEDQRHKVEPPGPLTP